VKLFQALVQSQQLRRGTDVAGPNEELGYWRRLYTEFSSIISHIESDYVKSFIQFLTEAKSKVIKVQEGHKFLILFLENIYGMTVIKYAMRKAERNLQ